MKYLNYTFRFIVFWLFFFFINRIVFASFFLDAVTQSSFLEIVKVLPYSLGLDISFISYLLVIITLLIWLGSFLSNKQFIAQLIYAVVSLFLIISGLVNGGEVSLYSEWNTKLNFTALSHFANPSEVFSTASIGHIITTFLFIGIGLIFIKVYKIKVHPYLPVTGTENNITGVIFKVAILPLMLGILLLGVRGGFQPIPINLSDAYFSNNVILNDIAVNPNWNILQSILKSKSSLDGNPYKKHSDEEAIVFIQGLKNLENDTNTMVLTTTSPNIVFILLESWSADNVESLDGLKGITPHFKALEKEGLLFTDFYANGWTSDQAMSSIYSSFPVFPYVAIINQADKSRKLPCLNKSLAAKGYHSSYFFGGQLTYGNIKGYLLSNGFDLVKDENDYEYLQSGALGVHDEFIFKQFKQELKTLPQPFMSSLFTISSHSPFDFPGEHKLSFNHKDDKYVNSVAYTDKCLGDFMESVKNEDWYANTLFIIMADHSHSSPIKRRVAQKERFKIPMLWMGEVLKEEYKGKKHHKMGSQIDISATVLSQLMLDKSAYTFGKSLFNPTAKVAAPYAFHKGYGLIRPEANYAFSESYNKVFESNAKDSLQEVRIRKETELYFQAAFKAYMEL